MHIGQTFYTEEELQGFGFKALGKNVKIKRNVGIFFTENLSIGDNVRIDDFVIIVAGKGVECRIGSYVHIASHCCIAGGSGFIMDDFSGFAPGVFLFTGSDDYSGCKLTNPTVPKKYIGGKAGKVVLKKHVIIGASTVILPCCTIGEGSSVGSMSLVTKDLEPWGVYCGVPVKRLKDRKKDLLMLEKELLEETAANTEGGR